MANELDHGDVLELFYEWWQNVSESLEPQGSATDHGGRLVDKKDRKVLEVSSMNRAVMAVRGAGRVGHGQ